MVDDLVLALDNSLDFLNLAISREGGIVEERSVKVPRLSSDVLPVRVSALLGDHGFETADLSCLVVTLGPGSFTGVRVGLAFCKGLAAGLRIPIIGVPTPDALAWPLRFMTGHYLCPIIDAKKGEVFFSLYRIEDGAVINIGGYHAVKPEELKERIPTPGLCFGTGIRICGTILKEIDGIQMIGEDFEHVSGKALLDAGMAHYRSNGIRVEHTKPIYGRRSEAEIKFNVCIP
jgi:tRNA threonylcarbamoyladenosine biosynthesis protein TsaB